MHRIRESAPVWAEQLAVSGVGVIDTGVTRESVDLTWPNDADELIAYDDLYEGQPTVVDALVDLYHWFGRYGVVRCGV